MPDRGLIEKNEIETMRGIFSDPDFSKNLVGDWTIEELEESVEIFNSSEDTEERKKMLRRFFYARIVYGAVVDGTAVIRKMHDHVERILLLPSGIYHDEPSRDGEARVDFGKEDIIVYSPAERDGMFCCSPKMFCYEPVKKIHFSRVKRIGLRKKFFDKKFIVFLNIS